MKKSNYLNLKKSNVNQANSNANMVKIKMFYRNEEKVSENGNVMELFFELCDNMRNKNMDFKKCEITLENGVVETYENADYEE